VHLGERGVPSISAGAVLPRRLRGLGLGGGLSPLASEGRGTGNCLMATLEEMADPGALRALREAEADAKAGRVYSYEEVFGRPAPRALRKRGR
jgi:hypothetical protein